MAKIGRIRFVNFTYNDNRHIYDQTLDFYNGEDTLLNLQNGGGKTVLVQMMMQPIIPNQKLKDRLFKSYFMNAKAPTYIMIEWILDDISMHGGVKRVLTGIGIKRVLSKSLEDENASIKIVTFLSEYEEGGNYDIKNMELTKEEKGVVKLLDFERVVKNLSEAEKEGNPIWIYRWNMAEDKKEYARRLIEYKINPAEWKNLMVRINEAEAGLNSFFNDCKTNKALIKKWFLPTIEEQLNQNGDLVENIRELIKNHAEQLVKNEAMITEREIFEDFKQKSSEIIASLENYTKLLEESQKNRFDLGNAYAFVLTDLKNLALEKEETTRQLKQIEGVIKELEYQRLSNEYYVIEDVLQQLNESILLVSQEMESMKAALGELEYQKNLLSCAKLRDDIANLNTKIAKFETELEKENLQQEDIKSMISDIQYSLKEKYREKVMKLTSALETEKQQLSEEKTALTKHQDEFEKSKQEVSAIHDQLIHIRSNIAIFQESEKTLHNKYSDFNPIKNIDTGEYNKECLKNIKEKSDAKKTANETNRKNQEEKRNKNRERLLLIEKECKDLRDKYPNLVIQKDKKESLYQTYLNEKQGIERILQSYQLGEDCLFDKEKIVIPLNSDKDKYEKLINDLNLENSILSKRLKQYESGKTFELTDELKQIFEDKNIFVEFGHDWLRELPEDKRKKLKLVKNNPFLPYSLIVSKKDFETMKDIELNGMLSPILPIIEREQLEKTFATKVKNNVYIVDDINFLIPFDDRVLNRNYVKETCDEISANIQKNDSIIEQTKQALKHIESDILRIESFSFTRRGVDELEEEIPSITGELEEITLKITDNEEKMVLIKKEDAQDISLQNHLLNEKEKIIREGEELQEFMDKCEPYSLELREKRKQEELLRKANSFLATTENEIARITNKINDANIKIKNLNLVLGKTDLQYQKYSNVTTGKLLNESIEELESKLAVYVSKTSGKIQALHDVLEDYQNQRKDKQKAINRYGMEERFYMGKEYNDFEYERLEEESNHIKTKLEVLSANKNDILLKVAERKSDLKYRMKSIEETCGCYEPLQRDCIKDLDFEQEKNRQKNGWKELEKRLTHIKKQDNHLQKVMFRLEEYKDFAKEIVKPQEVEEELGTHILRLIQQYKEYEILINDEKNNLAASYIEIESEFSVQAEVFKNLFRSILNDEKKYQPTYALNAFHRVFLQMDRKLDQHAIDIKKMDQMEKCIIDNTLSYLKNVYDEMNHIDRNSTIDLDGKRCKMLMIGLPQKEELESISLHEYLKSTILNCVHLYKHGKPMDGLLSNEINTYHLFDRFVGINKIEITLIKIEPNKLKKKTWRQVVEQNSGGELFVSAFVVFISLLTYMRGENNLNTNMDSKVLIMDNPFGPITSEHLLKPLFEISKKYNTQMICLTDVKGHTIYDRFNLIYSLNVEREVGREDEYIELKTIKKDVQAQEDEILSASMFKIEDKSRFELMN